MQYLQALEAIRDSDGERGVLLRANVAETPQIYTHVIPFISLLVFEANTLTVLEEMCSVSRL